MVSHEISRPQNVPAFDVPRHGFPDGGVNDYAVFGLHAHVLGERVQAHCECPFQ